MRRRTIPSELILSVVLAALVVLFGLGTPHFFSLSNLKAVISTVPVIAIAAIGMTFVLLIGGLDMSVGAIMGFTATAAVLFLSAGFPAWFATLLSLAIGACFGGINGFLIAKAGVHPGITTLGMMVFLRGLVSWFFFNIDLLKTGRINNRNFLSIARTWFPADSQIIPITFIYIIFLFTLASMVLRYTRFGGRLYAVGKGKNAAELSGINARRVRFFTYVISGISASLAGVILAAQSGIVREGLSAGVELEVITAAVLGGVSLRGGKGRLSGVIIAVIILGVLKNGMVHLETVTGISYYWREIIKGAMLVIAVIIDASRTRIYNNYQGVSHGFRRRF